MSSLASPAVNAEKNRAQTRRQVLTRALAGGAGALLAACRPPLPEAGPRPEAQPEVTIRFGVRAVNQTGNADWEDYSRGVTLFMSKYPRIKVELEDQMSVEKFIAGHAAGQAWDVQDTCCDHIPREARAGLLMKLDPFIKKSLKPEEVRDWIEWQIKFFTIDGAQYGIGRYMGTTALYYNRNWFQEKGVSFPDESWDWDRYREAMVRLSEPQNGRWGAYLILGADRRQAKVHQNGGRFVDPNDDMKSLLHTEPVIQAYQWIQDRMWKENSAIRQDQRGQPMIGARDLFLQGKVAMWEDGSWSLVPVLRN
jgi:multiple sugar transport system substrate-binding protein